MLEIYSNILTVFFLHTNIEEARAMWEESDNEMLICFFKNLAII
jgi:hypothetical protein